MDKKAISDTRKTGKNVRLAPLVTEAISSPGSSGWTTASSHLELVTIEMSIEIQSNFFTILSTFYTERGFPMPGSSPSTLLKRTD